MNTHRLFVLFAILGAAIAHGQSPVAPTSSTAAAVPATFIMQCEMVTIPAKLVPTLVPELNDSTKVVAAVEKLHAMITRGEATLTASLAGPGIFEKRSTAESVEEVRYATEYQPPQLPSTKIEEVPAETVKNQPQAGITPTAFETRNVGQTIVLEVTRTPEAKVLDCTYVVQHVRFEKFVKIDAGRQANSERLFVEQPYFSSLKNQSTASFRERCAKANRPTSRAGTGCPVRALPTHRALKLRQSALKVAAAPSKGPQAL